MATYINRECMNNMLDELCVNDSLYNALQTIPVIEIEPTQVVKKFAEKLRIDIKKLKASSQNKTYERAMQDMLDDIFPKIINDAVNDFCVSLKEGEE